MRLFSGILEPAHVPDDDIQQDEEDRELDGVKYKGYGMGLPWIRETGEKFSSGQFPLQDHIR